MSATNTPPVRGHVTVWGIDSAAAHAAFADFLGRYRPGAEGLHSLNSLEGHPCPLDLQHPCILASNSGPGWAWGLHDPAVPAPLREVALEDEDGCPCVDGAPGSIQ